jgi:hypothetical protein
MIKVATVMAGSPVVAQIGHKSQIGHEALAEAQPARAVLHAVCVLIGSNSG